jgi:hypothetical protein
MDDSNGFGLGVLDGWDTRTNDGGGLYRGYGVAILWADLAHSQLGSRCSILKQLLC